MSSKRFILISIIIVSLSIVIILIFLSRKQGQIEFNGTRLNGKVKWLKETPYKVELKNSEIEKLEIKSWSNLIDRTENFFNEDGKLIRTRVKPTPNKSIPEYSIKYIYNAEGLLVKREYFGSETSPYSLSVLKYNRNRQCMQEYFQNRTTKFVYYNDGKLKQEYHYNTKSILEFTYTYFYSDEFTTLKDVFSYDAKWHLFEEVEKDEMGNRMKFRMANSRVDLKKTKWETFKYEFDSYGNWVKQIRYVYGKPKYVVERVIKYY